MPTYRLEYAPKAIRQLDRLAASVRARLMARADALALDPRPAGAKRLAGNPPRYRVRVGNHRIVYRVEDEVLLVLVLRAGPRKSVYKDG